MKIQKQLIAGAVAAAFASTPALAADCEREIDQFEEQLESATLSDAQSDRFAKQLDKADDLLDAGRMEACSDKIATLTAQLEAEAGPSTSEDYDVGDEIAQTGEEIEQETSEAYANVKEGSKETWSEVEKETEEAWNETKSAFANLDLDMAIDDFDEDIVNIAGAELGELEGFVSETATGDKYVVVEVEEGWFSEKDVIVPVAHFEVNHDHELIYTGTKNFHDMDEFEEAGFEEIDNSRPLRQLSAR